MNLFEKACEVCKVWRSIALFVGEVVIVGLAVYGAYLVWRLFAVH